MNRTLYFLMEKPTSMSIIGTSKNAINLNLFRNFNLGRAKYEEIEGRTMIVLAFLQGCAHARRIHLS